MAQDRKARRDAIKGGQDPDKDKRPKSGSKASSLSQIKKKGTANIMFEDDLPPLPDDYEEETAP